MTKKEKSNLGLKVVSLFLAIFLWGFVMRDVNPEVPKTFKVDLELSNTDSLAREGLTVKDLEEKVVTVKISGKKSDVDEFNKESIKAIADLSGYEEGQKKVSIKVSLKNQMENIKIVDYEPKEVMITFDKIITEERPIKIRQIGELEEGYVLGDIESKIEKVVLEGPRTWLNEVSEVVAFVDLEGRKKSFTINTPLRLLDSEGNDVSEVEKDPESIDIDVSILRSKTVDINIKLDKDLPDDYEMKQVMITPSKISLKGDESVLGLSSVNTKPINVDDLIANRQVEVELDLPEGIELIDEDVEIKARLDLAELTEREFIIAFNEIELKNLNSDLDIDFDSEEKVDIIISGPKDQLSSLESTDIGLSLDMSDLEAGTHDVNIDFNVPSSFKVEGIMPKSIEVILKTKE